VSIFLEVIANEIHFLDKKGLTFVAFAKLGVASLGVPAEL
jgi:hypothetical protein